MSTDQPFIHPVRREAIIRGRGNTPKYPFPTMEVGDTFYVPRNADGKNEWNKLWSRKAYWEQKLPGRVFDIHSVSVGLRVQRVE